LGTALGTHFLIKKNRTHFKHLVNNSDKLVTVSEWFKGILQCNGIPDSQIEFIPNALPFFENNIKNIPKDIITKKPIQLLFIGRISHFKGVHLLIEALSSFEADDFELTIYGATDDESYEKKLKIQSAKMTNVKWEGVLPHSETLATMKNFDVFCLCSTVSEMAPLVIQESFAANLPVLASNVNGNKHLIKNDVNGLLFDFNSISSLRQQLYRLLHENGLVDELKSNISTPRMFDSVVENHLALYRNLVDKN
jgi:glycosyltransferase involved in cell wall biosynthesis